MLRGRSYRPSSRSTFLRLEPTFLTARFTCLGELRVFSGGSGSSEVWQLIASEGRSCRHRRVAGMEYRIRVGGAADTWQRWPSCHQQEATKASGLPERLGTARIRGLRRDGRLPRTERPVGGTPHWRRGHVAAIETFNPGVTRPPPGGLLVYPLDFFTRIALESNTVLVRTGADQDADHLAHRSAAAWANRIFMLFRHAAVPCQLWAGARWSLSHQRRVIVDGCAASNCVRTNLFPIKIPYEKALPPEFLQRQFNQPISIALLQLANGDDLAGDGDRERVCSIGKAQFHKDHFVGRRHRLLGRLVKLQVRQHAIDRHRMPPLCVPARKGRCWNVRSS